MTTLRSVALAGLLSVAVALSVWGPVGCGNAERSAAPPAEKEPRAPRPAPAPPPKVVTPTIAFDLPTREAKTPAPITKGQPTLAKDLGSVRDLLRKIVEDHGRDPENPWAITHAMLALGPDLELTNGKRAIDWLFTEYAKVVPVSDGELLTFPARRGSIRIEPHTDLVLKALTEGGVRPDREVTVDGKSFEVAALYKRSLLRAWVRGQATGFREGTYNDAPWALQGLAAWAPAGLKWNAEGGRTMTMSGFAHRLVEVLDHETKSMAEAMAAGQSMQKDTRRGLFRYTCGGQHLLQGAAYAVARGFHGEGEADQQEICEQLEILKWRIDVELGAIDPLIQKGDRPIQIVLLGQRLKFLGHTLETVHKIGALGLCPLDAAQVEASQRVARELVTTVGALGQLGVWSNLGAIREDRSLERYRMGGAEQVYLDFVGDAAHAVRGIDMATGEGVIRY